MIKQILKNLSIFAVVFLMAAGTVSAGSPTNNGSTFVPNTGNVNNTLWTNQNDNIQNTMGVGNTDPQQIAANVINIILGFLGILAVVLILFAGFKWMTAAGNEDKVGEAKKLLVAGVVGLLIILAAYAIAAFVLERIFAATT